MNSFQQYPKGFGLFGQIGRIICEVFWGIFGCTICSNFVTLYPWSMIFLQQKAKIFNLGLRLWFWAIENLGSSHHASVVCAAHNQINERLFHNIYFRVTFFERLWTIEFTGRAPQHRNASQIFINVFWVVDFHSYFEVNLADLR